MSDDLKEILTWLDVAHDDDEVISSLQNVMAELLLRYAFRVGDVMVYPLEIESYYWRKDVFEDPNVRTNQMQMKRFGRFYVYRSGRHSNSPYLQGLRACIGMVLSDSEDYFYTVLVRSATFSDGVSCFGPNNVLTHIEELANNSGLFKEEFFSDLEHPISLFDLQSASVLTGDLFASQTAVADDPRAKTPMAFAPRIGVAGHSIRFNSMPLRAVVGPLDVEHRYKEKRALIAGLHRKRERRSKKR